MSNKKSIQLSCIVDIFGNTYSTDDVGVTEMWYCEGNEGLADYAVINFENGSSAVFWSMSSFIAKTEDVKFLLEGCKNVIRQDATD